MIDFGMLRAMVFDNWRVYARTAVLVTIASVAAAAAAVLFTGCGDARDAGDAGELDDAGPELDDAGDAELDDAGELGSNAECGPVADPILSLPAERCTGHWADSSDSSTRFTPHPDTGLCTFACVWEDPRCAEDWFGDPRCFPAHAAVLGQLCAELGGKCELNTERTNRYCVVVP